jgi:tetratricopeptide (TPR) repeat protein
LAAATAAGAAEDAARAAATDQKRDELIADLRRMIAHAEGPAKADLLFQLGEYWWEKSRSAALREMKDFDDAYARWSAAREQKGAAQAGPAPRQTAQSSEGYREQALATYREVLDRYPRYQRRDEVLFVAGYNLYESGDKAQAMESYQALVRDHPQSRLLPDALVHMGEHYFAVNDLPRARTAFQRAVDLGLPKISSFALYKLAWCDYNAGDPAAAIEKFQRVIAYSDEQARAESAQRDRIQLKSEALKDMVLSYARLDLVEPAIAFLEQQGGDRAPEYVERLAGAYFEAGKFERAVRVYRLLEEKAPTHPHAAAWQQKILLACDKLNRRDEVLAQMRRLVNEYGPQSGWARANASEKVALAEAFELAESALRGLVEDYHQEAVRTRNPATYRLARDIYRQYLETYPQSASARRLRFYYGEILYALQEWEAAAAQYDQVAQEDPRGEYAVRAAFDQILALEKRAAAEGGAPRKGDGAQEPIPPLEAKLLAACERYLAVASGAKEEIAIRYKAALILYDRRHYAEAARRFDEIIVRWPGDPFAQKAADLSMSILEAQREWLALSELAGRFHGDRRLAPPGSEFWKRSAEVAENARFYYVMDLHENRRDLPAAAVELRKFVELYPQSRNAAIALNNELVIAEKADRLDLVIRAARQLLREHPGADEAILKPALLSLAAAATRTARFAEATEARLAFADRYRRDPRAPDQLAAAALWKEALGDAQGASVLWQRYLKEYPARPDAARVAFDLGVLLERRGEWRKAAEHWSAFLRERARAARPGALLLARYRLGLALRALRKDDRRGAAALSEVASRFAALPEAEKVPEVVEAAAHARFLALEAQLAEFLAIDFNLKRQSQLVRALQLKNARMARLVQACAEVIRAGSPSWSEAALTRLGEAYRNFNRALLQAPLPRGLDAAERELYRTALEEQALPLEDKAAEAFRKALETGAKVSVYSEWTLRAQQLLAEDQPGSLGPRHQIAARWAEPDLSERSDALALLLHPERKLDGAEQVLRQVLEQHPADADALHVLALVEADRGRPKVAEWALSQVRELSPRDPAAPNDLGVLALRRGDAAAARAHFEAATALDPRFAPAWSNLGALALSYRDYAAAADAYGRAARLEPSRWETRLACGWALEGQGKPLPARAEYEAVLALRPGQDDALFGRAAALRAEGDLAGARAAFQQYVSGETPARLKEALAQIAAIDLRLGQAAAQASAAPAAH